MAKRLTANQKAWNKEYKRIQRFVKNASKRGFIFDNVLPDKPSRITKKALSEIQSLKPNKLYLRAKYIDISTGEQLSGTAGRKLERSRAAKKSAETRKKKTPKPPNYYQVVVNQIIKMIEQFVPPQYMGLNAVTAKQQHKLELINYINQVINRDGREIVAQRIQLAGRELDDLVERILYASEDESINLDISRFFTIINGTVLSPFEMEEAMLMAEYINEGLEI